MQANNYKPTNHRILAQEEMWNQTICSFNDKETEAHRVNVAFITQCAKWLEDQIIEPEIKGAIQETAKEGFREFGDGLDSDVFRLWKYKVLLYTNHYAPHILLFNTTG